MEGGLDDSSLRLIMNYPKRTFTLSDSALTLTEAGLTGRREALFLSADSQESGENVVEVDEGEDSMEIDEPVLSEEWANAREAQKAKLDRELSEEGRVAQRAADEPEVVKPHVDKVAVFHMLVADGFDKAQAASASQRFGDSLTELCNMGFANHKLNLELLERYGGRMIRVVNALSERPVEEQTIQPIPTAPQLPLAQDAFQAKFAELVSEGMPPNEAAAQALLLLAPPPAPSESKWKNELEELSSMGFCEEERNISLLEKYQGRLVRVVNTLAGDE